MSSSLSVRTAGHDDLPALLDLYRHLIPEDRTAGPDRQRETFQAMLAQPGLTILFGVLENVPVASVTLVVLPNLTRGCSPYGLIENVVTNSGHRGKGYGRKLIDAAVDLAWDAGCYKVMLMSGSHNTDAHRFYERAGFQQSKTGFEIRRPGYPSRKPA